MRNRLLLPLFAFTLMIPWTISIFANDAQDKLQLDLEFQKLRAIESDRQVVERKFSELKGKLRENHPEIKRHHRMLASLNSQYELQAEVVRKIGEKQGEIQLIELEIISLGGKLTKLKLEHAQLKHQRDEISSRIDQMVDSISQTEIELKKKSNQLKSKLFQRKDEILKISREEITENRQSDRWNKLENRVDALEVKIDKILELLTTKDASQQ